MSDPVTGPRDGYMTQALPSLEKSKLAQEKTPSFYGAQLEEPAMVMIHRHGESFSVVEKNKGYIQREEIEEEWSETLTQLSVPDSISVLPIKLTKIQLVNLKI